MGKILEFKPKSVPEPTAPDNSALTVVGAEELRKLFNDAEVQGIKAELDFLDEMEKTAVNPAQTDVIGGEES